MREGLDFGARDPAGLYMILLCVPAAVAALAIVAMALRRPSEAPAKPRRLSALAGLSFWLSLLAFATVSVGVLLVELIRHPEAFSVSTSDYKDMLLAATVLGIVAVVLTGLSALMAVAALAAAGAGREKGVYGFGLAAMSLLVCLVTLTALYGPQGGLNDTTQALMEQLR